MTIELSGSFVPHYAYAIEADEPYWGESFTTADGVSLEWDCDMASGEWGYVRI